ncbi:MAG: hypothetical protein ACK4FG_06730 [Brevundimonas sp.]
MIGPRLRWLLILVALVYLGTQLVADFYWLRSNLSQETYRVDGIATPMWFGPLKDAVSAMLWSALLFTLLSIDARLQKKDS